MEEKVNNNIDHPNLWRSGHGGFNVSMINRMIQNMKIANRGDTNLISDGYHTFGELYEHRVQLFITVCRLFEDKGPGSVWRSKIHSDESAHEGWFLLGIGYLNGVQMSYHLPISKWDECSFAREMDRAPEFDGHTSADVLERLKNL